MKFSPQRVTVDPLTAAVSVDDRDVRASPADEAALEVALSLADHVTLASVGPPAIESQLRDLGATGADELVRVDGPSGAASRDVAHVLADVGRDSAADIVLCGDYSADRGSGSVPAFIAAELGAAQALGAVRVATAQPHEPSTLVVERRLDRGRREVLALTTPAVISVEGAVARLRRASLDAVVSAKQRSISVATAAIVGAPELVLVPHRPRVQARPGPDPTASPIERLHQVTDATSDREPPRVVTLEPDAAADEIIAQLQAWGYLTQPAP